MKLPVIISFGVALMFAIAFAGCSDAEPAARHTIAGSSAPFDAATLNEDSDAIALRLDEIFQEIAAGNSDQVFFLHTTVALQESMPLDEFRSSFERINSRLGALLEKQLLQIETNLLGGSRMTSATYMAEFEKGSGTLFVVMEKVDGVWMLRGMNVNAPELLDDPSEFRQPTEFYVVQSDVALPGSFVDVLDVDQSPPAVLIENAQVLNVRWKLSGPFTAPTAPAEGFVALGLSTEQTTLLESAGTLSIRAHVEPEPIAE